jgi:hypothetical protein
MVACETETPLTDTVWDDDGWSQSVETLPVHRAATAMSTVNLHGSARVAISFEHSDSICMFDLQVFRVVL